LGKSNRSLDLYKYKTKISGIISQRVSQASIERRNQQLISLALYYSNRMEQFTQKLLILMGQSDLTEEERQGLQSLMEFVTNNTDNISIEHAVSEVLARFSTVVPKLIDFYRFDIDKFESSPVSSLMKSLQPLVTVDEARKLVISGIVSPRKFSRACKSEKGRSKLAEKTGVDIERITMIYHSSRNESSKKLMRELSLSLAVLLMITSSIYVIVRVYAPRLPDKDYIPQTKIQSYRLPSDTGKPTNVVKPPPSDDADGRE
jgi:hypothetical protein